MIFGGRHGGCCQRYTTRKNALASHETALELAKKPIEAQGPFAARIIGSKSGIDKENPGGCTPSGLGLDSMRLGGAAGGCR